MGNPLTYLDKTITWENGRQLASISAAGLEAAYAYTPVGIRVSKTVNGVTTMYMLDGSMILRETVTGGGSDYTLNYTYDSLGNLVGIGYKAGAAAEVFYFVERNAQGDIIALYNSADSTKVGEYVYDSWGKLVDTIPTNDPNGMLQKNPFRYRGYYYDTETGLYYVSSRYYDPEICRFINADGTIGANKDLVANNLFAYCSNNPVNFSDPSGTEKEWVQLGFKYDGSAADFHRLEQGLSPLAYERWLANGGTVAVNKTVQEEKGITINIKNVTYVPAGKTKDFYIEKSKECIGPNVVDGVSLVVGIVTSVPKVANKIPYIGPAFLAFDVIRYYKGIMDKYDLEAYEYAMNQGEGVLVVVWSIEGAPSGNGTYTTYYSWNGVSNPFESR